MTKKFVFILLIVISLWIIVFGALLRLKFSWPAPTSTRPVSPSVAVPSNTLVPTGSRSWADQMLSKYPYEKGRYSGVLPAKSISEVWVFGKRIEPPVVFDPKKYIAIENSYGQFYAKLWERTDYRTQIGENLEVPTIATSAAQTEGGLVAARMTFSDNFGLVLEVRRLIPIPQ